MHGELRIYPDGLRYGCREYRSGNGAADEAVNERSSESNQKGNGAAKQDFLGAVNGRGKTHGAHCRRGRSES